MEPQVISMDGVVSGHFRVHYRGIPMVKNPFDYILYQMLVHEAQPDLIIEIGTHKGGGSMYLADLGNCPVHTIDIRDARDPRVAAKEQIQFFEGGYAAYDLANASGFENVLVVEDGSHTYEDSLACLQKFSPLVPMGGYYVVEDGSAVEGPLRAVHEFLRTEPRFVVDRRWCDFFGENVTFNRDGYLRHLYP